MLPIYVILRRSPPSIVLAARGRYVTQHVLLPMRSGLQPRTLWVGALTGRMRPMKHSEAGLERRMIMILNISLHEQFLLECHKALSRKREQQPLLAGLPGHPGRLAHRLASEVRGFSIGLCPSLRRLEGSRRAGGVVDFTSGMSVTGKEATYAPVRGTSRGTGLCLA
jgi:hypothetical protein